MTKSFFIAGTGTGVGKTLITAALCYQLTLGGYKVEVRKPVVSGFSYEDHASDPAILLQSLGRPVTRDAINAIAPWRFTAPLSPHMAAWVEGGAPRVEDVALFCRQSKADIVLVEGAGGLMTPLNDTETMLDLCVALGWPVILVAGTYLGTLSHTLTALLALRSKNIRLKALILSESAENAVPLADTARSIRMFAEKDAPLYTVPRCLEEELLWKHLPDLRSACL